MNWCRAGSLMRRRATLPSAVIIQPTLRLQELPLHPMISLPTRLLALAVLCFSAAAVHAADSIDALAQDVDRLESLREVKDLQRTYVHLSQAGLWNEMGALFSRDAQFIRGDETIRGSAEIARWLTSHGGGRQGLAPGAMRFEFIDQPLAN